MSDSRKNQALPGPPDVLANEIHIYLKNLCSGGVFYKEQGTSERKHRELQARILALPGTERVLRKLKKAGANREKVLSLVADTVFDTTFWLAPVKRQKKTLEDLANELETLATRAERVSLNPFSYGTLWLAMLGIGNWDHVKPPKERSPAYVFAYMRLYANHCRQRAEAFGELLSGYHPEQRRSMMDCVMLEIWLGTRKYYDRDVAVLLTNASEAAGQEREFTEDQIKKHRQRYVVPKVKLYIESHPEPGLQTEKGTIATP